MFSKMRPKIIVPICILIISVMFSSTLALGVNNKNHKKYTIDDLTEAILSNDQSKAKKILNSSEVDINTKDTEGIYPLEKTLVFNNYEMAKILLDSGANPDVETSSGETIRKIVNKGDSKIMKDLFNKYNEDNSIVDSDEKETITSNKRYTIDDLTEAILSNDQSKVKKILNSGEVDINAKDTEGIYPLEKTLVFNNYEMAKILLDSGANPDIETSSGETIREIVNKGDSKMMKKLFAKY